MITMVIFKVLARARFNTPAPERLNPSPLTPSKNEWNMILLTYVFVTIRLIMFMQSWVNNREQIIFVIFLKAYLKIEICRNKKMFCIRWSRLHHINLSVQKGLFFFYSFRKLSILTLRNSIFSLDLKRYRST